MEVSRICRVVILLLLVQSSISMAHAPDQGNVFLQIEDDSVRGRVEITLKDLNTALALDLPTEGQTSLTDIQPYLDEIREYVLDRVELTIGDVSGPPPITDIGLLELSFATFLQLHFAYLNLPEEPILIDVRYSALFDVQPEHRGMLVVETYWKSGTFDAESNLVATFSPGDELQTVDLSSSSTLTGFMAMVGLGTHHIWIGIDHILFLLALLLPAVVYRDESHWRPVDRFRPAIIHVIKVVTLFTIAHTITLSLAALKTIELPSRLVESVIAISIAIAALHILYPVFRGKIWWVVFAFGLFHGFGFASVLGEIGIPESYIVHSLLGFNLGVELGQLAIVAIVFPLLFVLRLLPLYTRAFLPVAASALVVVSLYWFIERAFMIDLPAGAIVNSVLAFAS